MIDFSHPLKDEKLTIMLPKELLDQLKDGAKEHSLKVSTYARRILESFVKQKEMVQKLNAIKETVNE